MNSVVVPDPVVAQTSVVRKFGAVGWLFLLLAIARPVFAAGEPTAEERLAARGLVRIGHTWCLPEEADLRRQINALDPFEPRLVAAQQAVDQLVAQNETCRLQTVRFAQLEKQARGLSAAAKQGTPEKAQFESQAKQAAALAEQWKRQYVPNQQFGLSPPLKTASADLNRLRTDVTLRLLPIREAMDRLAEAYEVLRRDKDVMAAIASLGQDESLGPQKHWRDGAKNFDKLQAIVFSDSLPVVREGQFYRVTAIVGERQPLTFSFMGTGSEPTLIPQNLAEAAGLVVDEHAPKVKLRVAGRQEQVRRIKVSQMRFGRHLLTDVDAYVLPPEAADLGARISAAAFSGLHVQLDADRLRLDIGARSN